MILWQINPTERTIRSVDLPTLPEGYNNDPRFLNEMGDVVYTLKQREGTSGFLIEGIRAPIVGIAFVSGTNEAGDDVPPKVAYDSLVDAVDFGRVDCGMFYGDRYVRTIQ